MPHRKSGSDANTASAANLASSTSAGPEGDLGAAGNAASAEDTASAEDRVAEEQAGAEVKPAGDRSAAHPRAVFGVKAARGQQPYAIVGRSGSKSADSAATAGRGGSRSAPASAHSMRVAGGQVVDAEAAADEAAADDSGKGVREVKLPPLVEGLGLEEKPAEAMRLAQEAFSQTGYWISFYRAILGVEGVVFKLFPSREEMDFFEESAEFAEIHTMLTALRTSDIEKIDAVEPQAMITVRMPRSLRAVLVEEAKHLEVSINKLCISKLLIPINPQFVPTERGKVRGRKPGQQARSNRAKTSHGAKAGKG